MADAHTAGPWQIKDDYTPEGRITIIANVDGEYFTDSPSPRMTCDVIAVCADEFGETLSNATANARLIASAPDLLEALPDVIDAALRQLSMMGKGRAPSPRLEAAIERARTAIAKATQP